MNIKDLKASHQLNILVVGNGLDVGLGYHTEYKDLYQYLKYLSKNQSKVRKKFNQVNQYFPKRNMLWCDFEDNLGKVKANSIHNSTEANRLWINIKYLFKLWTEHLSECSKDPIPVYSQYKKYSKDPGKYKHKQQNKILSDYKEYKLIRKLIKESTLIINFNYTRTIELHLSQHYSYLNDFDIDTVSDNDCILHLHGDCKSPITGHGQINNINKYDKFAKIFLQLSRKHTFNIYEDVYQGKNYEAGHEPTLWFNKLDNLIYPKHKYTITFFGVSYSQVDQVYFYYIREHIKSYEKSSNIRDKKFNAIFYFYGPKNQEIPSKITKFAKYLIRIGLIDKNNIRYLNVNSCNI